MKSLSEGMATILQTTNLWVFIGSTVRSFASYIPCSMVVFSINEQRSLDSHSHASARKFSAYHFRTQQYFASLRTQKT